MPIYLIVAEIPGNAPYIDHINAPDLATAQTRVTNAIQQRYSGANVGAFNVALLAVDAAFQVTA